MGTGKIILWGILTLIIIFAFIIAIGVASYGISWVAAPFQGMLEKRQEVQSGDFRLYSYEHFYDMYASAKAYTQKIENQKIRLENTEDKEERRKIRRNLNGLRNKRTEVIQEYNSDARKEESRGQFRAKDLPYKLEKEGLE